MCLVFLLLVLSSVLLAVLQKKTKITVLDLVRL